MNSFNGNENDKMNKNSNLILIKQFKNIKRKLFDFFIIILNLINLALISSLMMKKTNLKKILKENNLKTKNMKVELDKTKMIIAKNQKTFNNNRKDLLLYEKNMPHLNEIIKKRTFEKRLPLPKEIKCTPHFRKEELIAFLSLLTKDTIFFETGSGCSSVIAKYYAKKAYAVEGCKKYYELGIKNGLKDVLLFNDLKPDNPTWSFPGNKTNISDWKKYFQAYKKEYNADVILIDGRFKVATAMDIFNKIRNDTIILLHEYFTRPSYFILENYYNYVYHWGSLFVFVKKKNIKQIPMEIQKKYWNQFM
jgi:hypothetical protein